MLIIPLAFSIIAMIFMTSSPPFNLCFGENRSIRDTSHSTWSGVVVLGKAIA
jgi:hypothetical protein